MTARVALLDKWPRHQTPAAFWRAEEPPMPLLPKDVQDVIDDCWRMLTNKADLARFQAAESKRARKRAAWTARKVST